MKTNAICFTDSGKELDREAINTKANRSGQESVPGVASASVQHSVKQWGSRPSRKASDRGRLRPDVFLS